MNANFANSIIFLNVSLSMFLGIKQRSVFPSISLAWLYVIMHICRICRVFVWCDFAWTHRSSSRGRLDWRRRFSQRASTSWRKPRTWWDLVNVCWEDCSLLPFSMSPIAVLSACFLLTFSFPTVHATLKLVYTETPFRSPLSFSYLILLSLTHP